MYTKEKLLYLWNDYINTSNCTCWLLFEEKIVLGERVNLAASQGHRVQQWVLSFIGKNPFVIWVFLFFQKWLYFVVYASICASLRLTPRRITLAGIDAGRIFDIWALNGEGLRVVRRKFGRFHLLAGSTFAIGSSLAAETNKKAKVSSLQPRR